MFCEKFIIVFIYEFWVRLVGSVGEGLEGRGGTNACQKY